MTSPSYEAVIGLEVHVQLRTASKAFCGCAARFGDAPNTNTCPVCLGYPGALPVLNRSLVEAAVRLGLAFGASFAPASFFARKHYVYPDLPKGYQITQADAPACTGGTVAWTRPDGSAASARLVRIHMEEDAGKLLHDPERGTLADMNRAGIPLLEIVTEPVIRSASDASLFLQAVRRVVTYLGICDGSMEEGSLRCDANVSVRPGGSAGLGTKTELKNLNSFRNVERAITFEIARQRSLLESAKAVEPATLQWDADREAAHPMRAKESRTEYRYSPEPDLGPVVLDAGWLEELRRTMPELPEQRQRRFAEELGLPAYDAGVLTAEAAAAGYFESVLAALGGDARAHAKQAANWVMTEVLRLARDRGVPVDRVPVGPERLAALLRLVDAGAISGTAAKEVFAAMAATGAPPEEIVAGRGLAQLSDHAAITALVADILARHASQAARYRAGEERLFGFFVGEVMKASGGRANPGIVNAVLKQHLS
jgi:aspartyl-tRNA(Asn)/glutamyl-tRNA(Gln) amidotransferase subunit B